MEQQQRQSCTAELRAQLGAMSVEGTSVSAGPGEGGGTTPIQTPAGGGATGGVQGGSRGSSGLANLNERKRVLVASMSPEDVVNFCSLSFIFLRYVIVLDRQSSCRIVVRAGFFIGGSGSAWENAVAGL
ncbi:unnamed protein product [Ectocarpus sp. 13 AM-2016]